MLPSQNSGVGEWPCWQIWRHFPEAFYKLTVSSYFILQLWNTFNHNFSPRISYSLKCPVLLRLLPLVLFSFTTPTFKNQHEAVLFHCPLIKQHNDSRLYYNVLSSDFLISIFTHLAICFSLNSLISRLLTWFINFLSHCDRKLNDSSTHTQKKTASISFENLFKDIQLVVCIQKHLDSLWPFDIAMTDAESLLDL